MLEIDRSSVSATGQAMPPASVSDSGPKANFKVRKRTVRADASTSSAQGTLLRTYRSRVLSPLGLSLSKPLSFGTKASTSSASPSTGSGRTERKVPFGLRYRSPSGVWPEALTSPAWPFDTSGRTGWRSRRSSTAGMGRVRTLDQINRCASRRRARHLACAASASPSLRYTMACRVCARLFDFLSNAAIAQTLMAALRFPFLPQLRSTPCIHRPAFHRTRLL
jgi:hypothetical protein